MESIGWPDPFPDLVPHFPGDRRYVPPVKGKKGKSAEVTMEQTQDLLFDMPKYYVGEEKEPQTMAEGIEHFE